MHLSGLVKNFVLVKPSKVFLKGYVGEPLSKTVMIIPGDHEKFKILHTNALKGKDFKYSLKETKIEGKKAYELTVENTRKIEGRYFDKIFMITDRKDQQPIQVIVSGYIDAAKAEGQPAIDKKAAPEHK